MNSIKKAWEATFVRRWHTHPQLSKTDDYNSGHQHRCTILLLCFWPDSTRESIIDTLTHDQGEIDSGDMAFSAKRKFPNIRESLADVEKQAIIDQKLNIITNITDTEYRRRKFVDLLDSYLWMLLHEPKLTTNIAWIKQKQNLFVMSELLDIEDHYISMMKAFTRD